MAIKQATPFPAELLDQLLSGRDSKTALEADGLIGDLKNALAKWMPNAEMDVHLDQEEERAPGNHRNGSSAKTVPTSEGPCRCRFGATATAASIRC